MELLPLPELVSDCLLWYAVAKENALPHDAWTSAAQPANQVRLHVAGVLMSVPHKRFTGNLPRFWGYQHPMPPRDFLDTWLACAEADRQAPVERSVEGWHLETGCTRRQPQAESARQCRMQSNKTIRL